MTALVRYEAALRAIAECRSVDEVKSWADKAAAMQAYQRMAGNKTLEIDAAEIRIRAERRLGEMLAQSDLQKGGRPSKTGRDSRPVFTPTLAQVGISKDLSSRAQKIAAVPEDEFEAEVGEWRERVSAENARVTTRLEKAGERATKKRKAEPEPAPRDELEDAVAALTEENARLGEEIDTLKRAADPDAVTKISQLKAYIKTVESQRDDWMNQCAMLKREIKRLQRQLGSVNA